MSVGKYNPTFFANNPDIAKQPGLLYCVVLVNKVTMQREAVKIGITKGTSFRDTIKRSLGFKGYDIRIQKLVTGTLEEVFYLEQYLHELWSEHKYVPMQNFGGWTECFNISVLPDIIKSIPSSV